jgi:hypothetical protein
VPFGPGALGLLYFVGTKFAGYSAYAAYFINRSEPVKLQHQSVPSPLLAGAVRTAIGVGIGAVVGILFWKIPEVSSAEKSGDMLFFLFLVPVRVFEWWALLGTVYRNFSFGGMSARLIGGGILASFLLDAVGIACTFVLPGGIWVC